MARGDRRLAFVCATFTLAALSCSRDASAQRWPPYPGTQPTKAADRAVVFPGGTIVWTITFYNDAVSSTADVSVFDSVPRTAGVVEPFDPARDILYRPAGSSVSYSGGSLTVDDIDLAADASDRVVFQTRVSADAPDGSLICNQAWVHYLVSSCGGMPPICRDDQFMSGSMPPGESEPDRTCVSVRAPGSGPFIEATKTHGDADGVATPGELVTYTITLLNTGASGATGIEVVDVLDPALRTVDPGTGTLIPGPPDTITWSIASLGSGLSSSLTFTAEVTCAVTEGVPVCNQATITAAELTDPVLSDDPATGAFFDATCLDVTYEHPLADAGGPGPVMAPARIGSSPCDPDLEYLWTPTSGLDFPTRCDPTADPGATTEYCLIVRDGATGCESEPDCVTVEVETSEPCSGPSVPGPIQALKAVKRGDDVHLQWLEESLALGGYHGYRVTDKPLIPTANLVGMLVVDTAEDFMATSADDLGAVPGPAGEIFHYQLVGVCSDGSEGAL